MQIIEKMTNFRCFFGHLKVFNSRKKFVIANKHRKKAFKGDCLEKLREASAFVKVSVNAKIFKKSAKNQFFTALGAPEDFKIFD